MYRTRYPTLEKSLVYKSRPGNNDVLLLSSNGPSTALILFAACSCKLGKWNASSQEKRFRRTNSMTSPSLDIFKEDLGGNPVWVDAFGDLETARCVVHELASVVPSQCVF